MNIFLTLFCPHCHHYLGPHLRRCHHCNRYERPPQEVLPPPEQPFFWEARLPGAAAGAVHLHDELLAAAWRSRSKEPPAGGVTWLGRFQGRQAGEEWRVEMKIVGEPVFERQNMYVCLASRSTAAPWAVAAMDLEAHRLLWGPLPVDGALDCGPVLLEGRVYAAAGDGQVYVFNAQTGERYTPLRYLPLHDKFMAGPPDMVKVRNNLVVAAPMWEGKIYLVTTSGVHLLARLQDFISKLAVAPDGYILAATQSGRLYAVDPRRPSYQVLRYDAKKRIDSAPLQIGQTIFTAAEHTFYALQPGSGTEWQVKWSFAMEGSLICAPLAWGEWLFLGDSHGWLYALDQQNGQELWRHVIHPHSASVNEHQIYSLSMPESGRLVAAARSGKIVCLPWHLGKYESQAERVEAQWKAISAQNQPGNNGKLLELADQAATWWAAAASAMPDAQAGHEFRQRAAHWWERSSCPEKAGYLWLDAGEHRLAAEAFTHAARGKRLVHPEQAEQWLKLALQEWGRLTWDIYSSTILDDQQKEHEINRVEADRQKSHAVLVSVPGVKVPLIKMRLTNPPNLIAHAGAQLPLDLHNTGTDDGAEINLLVSGGLVENYRLPKPGDPPLPAFTPGAQWTITMEMKPTRSTLLRVDINYRDKTGQFSFETTQTAQLNVEKSLKIDADYIGLLKLEAVNVVIDGNKFGSIRAEAENVAINGEQIYGLHTEPAPAQPQPTPEFAWPAPWTGYETSPIIIAVCEEIPGDEFSIPTGHWACFLADQQLIAQTVAGRHKRQQYPPLAAGLLGGRRPQWQAVVFSTSEARLFFRLGPFLNEKEEPTGIDLGLTIQVIEDGAYKFWQDVSQGNSQVSAEDLVRWLNPEISGILQAWIKRAKREDLEIAFERREGLMLTLEEELKNSLQRHRLSLVGLPWGLRFIKATA